MAVLVQFVARIDSVDAALCVDDVPVQGHIDAIDELPMQISLHRRAELIVPPPDTRRSAIR